MPTDTPLLDWSPPESERHGETFDAAFDYARLNLQQRVVYDTVKDGGWWTPHALEERTGYGWASISARLRDLRKQEFGGFIVDRERVPGAEERGLYRYRLRVPGKTN
jgi:hypothetical protein